MKNEYILKHIICQEFIVKKTLLGILALFFLSSPGFTQQNSKKVLILPLQNKIKTSDFAADQVANFEDLSFYGLYNFFVTLPFTEMPAKDKLRRTSWDSDQISTLGKGEKADYIIYGTYTLQGDKFEPDITINLKVWGGDKIVFSRTYETRLDLDIFDTIDLMIIDALESAFKIKARIATLDFNNFKIGNEDYVLYVNNKEIAQVKGRDFNLSLKVLADTDYTVQLERVKDRKIVLEQKLKLKPGENRWVNYQAQGTVNLGTIGYKENKRTYKVQINGQDIQEGQSLSGLEVGIPYNLLILDDKNLIQGKESFYLKDGDTLNLSPSVNWGGAFHIRVWTMGGSLIGLGFDYFLSRPFWLGFNTGFTFSTKQVNGQLQNIYAVTPGLEAGFYILGHMARDFRLGIGAQLNMMLALPADTWALVAPGTPATSLIPAVFIALEWKNIQARFNIVKDFGSDYLYFQPSLGLKF